MERPILTIIQAAKMLQVDPNTIYRWARAGKFPASKIGKEWRVLRSDVIKFVESKKRRYQLLSESQERELITALVGRREIPLKLEYFGEGADRYTSFTHPAEVGGESEFEIIKEHGKKIVGKLGNKHLNILDLGGGDGKKAAYFISFISNFISGYFPLDISRRMIEITEDTVKSTYPNLTLEAFHEDFEQGNITSATYYLHRRYQRSNLILFLGNTVGNISDAHRVLVNIRESMTEEDFLLVGLAFFNPKNIPLREYNNMGMINWLWSYPEKLGIEKKYAKIYCIWNETKRQVEFQLEFTTDWKKMLGGNLLQFGKGQKVLLGISRRFTKDNIFELFAKAGFKIEIFVHDKDNALVLCRPHEWEKRI